MSAQTDDRLIPIGLRVLPSMRERAADLVRHLQTLRRAPASVADVYREALAIGLDALERDASDAG